jgi:hypothetical protein
MTKNANEYFQQLAIKREMEDPLSELFDFDIEDNLFDYHFEERKKKLPKLYNVTFFDEILDRELPPEKWLIDGIIPEMGLHLLLGAGKVGKSWFAFQCAQAIATGGMVFNRIPVNKNKVLYINLAESWQLLLKRAKILGFSKTGNNLMLIEDINNRRHSNSVYTLEEMLGIDPSIRLVIIDPIQLFLTEVHFDKSVYTLLNCFQTLKRIAFERQVSILIVRHTIKCSRNDFLDFIERSLGKIEITTICDTIIYLTRPRNDRRADMYVSGREIMDKAYTLRMNDNCEWVLEGDKREVTEGDTQKLIVDWIKENGSAQPIDIYNGLKAEGYMGASDTIRQTCHRMKTAGKLKNDKGTYSLFTSPVTSVTVSQLENE